MLYEVITSMEQRAGAEQINSAIQELNSVTQMNASSSSELSTQSVNLSGMADELVKDIAYFKVWNLLIPHINTHDV